MNLFDSERAEAWRPVKGYEGCYEVSDRGRVRSLSRTICFMDKQRLIKGRIMKLGVHTHGYRSVGLRLNGNVKTHVVHRLVLLSFHPERLPGMEVDHINNIRHDNRLENLRWVSRAQNMARQVELGTRIMGDTHPNTTLPDAKVVEAVQLRDRGWTLPQIGRHLGVSSHVAGYAIRTRSRRMSLRQHATPIRKTA